MSTQSSSVSNVGPPNFLGCAVTYQFLAAFRVDRNLIEVPSLYHRQWTSHYPPYVLFDYNGDKHFIKLRKFGNRYYFSDGLKDFRRTMGIHKGVMVSFAAPDKNWSFHLHFIPPLHRQTCGRPPTITRTHVFTVDVSHCMISRPYPLFLPLDALNSVNASTKYITVQRSSGRHHLWKISMHNGLQSLAGPWYQFLTENDLMAGDEVMFYYQPNHVWEVLFRKQLTWHEDESS
ncbi:hypothetical protein GmHk_09G026120 [Glycine max]|nr:hypothetical protein GmHk_09G026120 [Glycine max]